MAISVVSSAKPKVSDKEINLRIGTYNVWSHSARKYVIKKNPSIKPRNWDASKQAVAELQETTHTQPNTTVILIISIIVLLGAVVGIVITVKKKKQ